MPPVPWVTTAPDLVEKIIAVMLSRENGRAVRIRPSQGDGGLDVVCAVKDHLTQRREPVLDGHVGHYTGSAATVLVIG